MRLEDSFVFGTVYYFGSKEELAQILAEAGFEVQLGHWAIRIDRIASNFELAYVGNLSPDEPFDVDGNGCDFSVEAFAASCARLAGCLQRNGIGFDFTHVSGDQERELGHYEFRP